MPNYPAGGPKKLGVIVFALNMQFKAVKAVVVLSGLLLLRTMRRLPWLAEVSQVSQPQSQDLMKT
jgi:hypothetical protein